MFTPTRTMAEWVSFRDHLLSWVSMGTCIAQYPWCDTPDITLANGQVWAACNVGASIAGIWAESYGSSFQWWRNHPFPTTGPVPTITWPIPPSMLIAADIANQFITSMDYDWLSVPDANRWWGADLTTTYQAASSSNQSLMQGPCSAGYHIPTNTEIQSSLDLLWSSWLWVLIAPLSEFRNTDASLSVNEPHWYGYWWTSSPFSWGWNIMYWDISDAYSPAGTYRTIAVPIRCLRN